MSIRPLLKTIGYPGRSGTDHQASEELYTLARRNKIGSLYVQSLNDADAIGSLGEKLENRQDFQQRVTRTVEGLAADVPDHYQYAVVKSNHEFWADSKDVDIVLFDDNLMSLKQDFTDAGYEFIGDSPTTFDVMHPETNIQIDAQSDFSLQNVVYFDKHTIADNVTMRNVRGTKVPVAARPDDLALIVIHSVTEQLFILKEYYAALHALENFNRAEFDRFVRTVEVNDIEPACRAFFPVVAAITQEIFGRQPPYMQELLHRYPPYERETRAFFQNGMTTPHRYTRQTGLRTIIGKVDNEVFLRSLISQIPRLAQPDTLTHIVKELLARREREHYVHDTSDMQTK